MKNRHDVLLVGDGQYDWKPLSDMLKDDGVFHSEIRVCFIEDAIEIVNEQMPDLVVMDIESRNWYWLQTARLIKQAYSEVKLALLVPESCDDKAAAALTTGADAFCSRDMQPGQLVDAFKDVLLGSVWLSPTLAKYIYDFFQNNR